VSSYRKLGVNNRTAAARWAQQSRLVADEYAQRLPEDLLGAAAVAKTDQQRVQRA
jgi:hypothetical protein